MEVALLEGYLKEWAMWMMFGLPLVSVLGSAACAASEDPKKR
jgi:hypothetical protein